MIFISVIVTSECEVLAQKQTCCCCTAKKKKNNKPNNKKREIAPDLPCWLESVVVLV